MKEKIRTKGIKKRLFSVVLALAMIISLVPIGRFRVYAYESLPTKLNGYSVTWTGGWVISSGNICPCSEALSWVIKNDGSVRNVQKVGGLSISSISDFIEGTYEATCSIHSTHTFTLHKHTWNYTPNGAKLTAASTCYGTSGCEYLTQKIVTLTLNAEPPYYSGGPAVVKYGDGEEDAWEDVFGDGSVPSIKYFKEDGTTETDTAEGAASQGGAPSKVGNYVAKAVYTDTVPDPDVAYEISLNFEIKDHNFSPATSTMIGITLDDDGMTFDDAKTAVGGISGYTPVDGDIVIFGYDSGSSKYKHMNYNGTTWEYTDGGSNLATFEEIKNAIVSGKTVYVIGTVQEPAPAPVTHVHSFASDWSSDKEHHWHACTAPGHNAACLLELEAKKDKHGPWKNGKCGTCNYACLHNGATKGICPICKKNLGGGSGGGSTGGGSSSGGSSSSGSGGGALSRPPVTSQNGVANNNQDNNQNNNQSNNNTSYTPAGSNVPVSSYAHANAGKAAPLIRMFNPVSGEHIISTDPNEAATLETKHGRKREAISGTSSAANNSPVYRLVHPATGKHMLSTTANEIKVLTEKMGWETENVVFFAGRTKIRMAC